MTGDLTDLLAAGVVREDPPGSKRLVLAEAAAQEDGDPGFDLYDETAQLAMSWTLRLVARTLGVKDWVGGDGSETVEGDVSAEIWNILTEAGLVDDDGLRLPPPATSPAAAA